MDNIPGELETSRYRQQQQEEAASDCGNDGETGGDVSRGQRHAGGRRESLQDGVYMTKEIMSFWEKGSMTKNVSDALLERRESVEILTPMSIPFTQQHSPAVSFRDGKTAKTVPTR